MNLALAPERINAPDLITVANWLRGMDFSEDGHYCYSSAILGTDGVGDCVFYLFQTFKLAGLWPKEWQGVLPLALRQVRLRQGSRLSTLDDFPVIRQFLELNAARVEGKPKDADIVLMRWGNREGGAHHVALWAGEGLYHLPYNGVSGWEATSDVWESRILEVWRLNAVIQD